MKKFINIGMTYSLGGALLRPVIKTVKFVQKRDKVRIHVILQRGISAIRGRNGFTMVRRSLVVDWNPPKELSAAPLNVASKAEEP